MSIIKQLEVNTSQLDISAVRSAALGLNLNCQIVIRGCLSSNITTLPPYRRSLFWGIYVMRLW